MDVSLLTDGNFLNELGNPFQMLSVDVHASKQDMYDRLWDLVKSEEDRREASKSFLAHQVLTTQETRHFFEGTDLHDVNTWVKALLTLHPDLLIKVVSPLASQDTEELNYEYVINHTEYVAVQEVLEPPTGVVVDFIETNTFPFPEMNESYENIVQAECLYDVDHVLDNLWNETKVSSEYRRRISEPSQCFNRIMRAKCATTKLYPTTSIQVMCSCTKLNRLMHNCSK